MRKLMASDALSISNGTKDDNGKSGVKSEDPSEEPIEELVSKVQKLVSKVKRMASDASSISNGSKNDNGKTGVQSEEPSEEPIEELLEESVSQPSSDSENNYTEQPCKQLEEELNEEPSKDSASQPSSDCSNDDTEQPNGGSSEKPDEEPTGEPLEESVSQPSSDNVNDDSEKPIEEPGEEPFEESVSQPSSDSDNDDTEHRLESVPINSNEKKRSLDATAGKSGLLQVYRLPKKCKQEQSLEPESDVQSAIMDPRNKSGIFEEFVNDGNASGKQERSGSSGKRRRSRWDPQPEDDGEGGEGSRTSKKRKTRWASDNSQLKMLGPIHLPDFVKEIVDRTNFDPEFQELNMKLLEINRKLQGAEVHDDRPEEERSPSPLQVYDNLGIRMNSRNARFREKLVRDRQSIISRLIQKNPTFKPPPNYKPRKLCKKLYIPIKEYPGYNFVGLIIGPRGLTIKRMEKNTGARIVLRGKGSQIERRTQLKPDPADNEDLHVLVEADNQKSLDEAVRMVEKILIPVDEGINEHKRLQLKELAKLNGTLRDENLCKVCGEEGHKHYACPSSQNLTFSVDVSCDTCGGSTHPTAKCPLTASAPGSNVGNQHPSFLGDLGRGGGLALSTSPISSMPWWDGNTGLGTSPSYGSYFRPGLGSTPTTDSKSNKEVDDSKLYVGYLPQSVDDNRLIELFSPFGRLTEAKVIKDRSTGFSKGYGFVKFDGPIRAATALSHMNGYKIDGKMLAVKVAGQLPPAGCSSISLLPKYPGSARVSQDSPSQAAWPGPPGSMLPEPQSSFSKSEGLGLPPLSVFLGHSDSSTKQLPSSYGSSYQIPISSPGYLAWFPGNPDYLSSKYQSYFTTPSNPSPHFHLTRARGSSMAPHPWVPIHPPWRDTKAIEFEYEKFM